jgi:formyl-CoA transferase
MPEHMRGDDTLGGQDGSDYQYTHRNKRSITLNLKLPEGIETLKKLVATADVLLENFRPDVKYRLGIDYESLSKINRSWSTRASPVLARPVRTRRGPVLIRLRKEWER